MLLIVSSEKYLLTISEVFLVNFYCPQNKSLLRIGCDRFLLHGRLSLSR